MPTGLGLCAVPVSGGVVGAGLVRGVDVDGGDFVGAAVAVEGAVEGGSALGVTGGGRSAKYTRTMSTSKKAIRPAVINPRFIREPLLASRLPDRPRADMVRGRQPSGIRTHGLPPGNGRMVGRILMCEAGVSENPRRSRAGG